MSLLTGLARIQFQATGDDNQAIRNTFYIANPGDDEPSAALLTVLSEELYAYLGDAYRGMLTDGMVLDAIVASQVPDPLHPVPYIQTPLPVDEAGTRTGGSTSCNQSICAVMSMQTGFASRRFRSHMFLPPARILASLSGNGFATGNAYWTGCAGFKSALNDGTSLTPTWTGTELPNWSLAAYSRAARVAGAASWIEIVEGLTIKNTAHWLRSRTHGST